MANRQYQKICNLLSCSRDKPLSKTAPLKTPKQPSIILTGFACFTLYGLLAEDQNSSIIAVFFLSPKIIAPTLVLHAKQFYLAKELSRAVFHLHYYSFHLANTGPLKLEVTTKKVIRYTENNNLNQYIGPCETVRIGNCH